MSAQAKRRRLAVLRCQEARSALMELHDALDALNALDIVGADLHASQAIGAAAMLETWIEGLRHEQWAAKETASNPSPNPDNT